MASMEQLNEFEKTANQQHWGIDKKIPVALILVVVFQTLGFTWGAATLSSEVRNNGKTIEKLERKVEKIASTLDVRIKDLQSKSASIREYNSIEKELDEIKNRLITVERKLYKSNP